MVQAKNQYMWAHSCAGPSLVHSTLLYIRSEAIIPAEAETQSGKTGFRVKPGMTN